ncbi:MAG TPA: hypothetical protein VKY19_24110 [Ktedonosporobacter sp.]|jgi:hypothetical protein|nr:hypothetical protein [Ktedonosporobacter sp.]
MAAQRVTRVRNVVFSWFSRMMLSSATRYGMLSIAILMAVVGLATWSAAALHLPVLHMLGSTLQLSNKVPFGEPWPQP